MHSRPSRSRENLEGPAASSSDNRCARILRATNDAFWDWDLVTGAVERGGALQTLLGYAPEELTEEIERRYGNDIARWWRDQMHPDDRERITAELQAFLASSSEVWSSEYRFRRRDGSYVFVLDRAVAERDAAGRPVRLTGAMADITARKEAEEALRRSQADFADFFENGAIGCQWVGPDGIILRANRTQLEMLGYAPEEYVGRHIAEFHADPGLLADILRRLSGHETIQDCPARLRRRDGSIVHVLINSSVLWREGKFIHTRCFTRDVTARMKAEDEARARAQELERVMESVPAIVWIAHDSDCRKITGNRAATEFLRLAPGSNQSLTAPPEEVPRHFRVFLEDGTELAGDDLPVQAAARGREMRDFEEYVVFEDGSVRHLYGNATPLWDSNGRICGSVAAFVEITDRKRAAERAKFLAEAGDALSRSLDYESTLDQVAGLAVKGISDWCAVHMVGDGGKVQPIVIRHRDPARMQLARELVRRYPYDPKYSHGLAQVLATGRTKVYPEIGDELLRAAARDEDHYRTLRTLGMSCAVLVPLRARERTLGVLTLVWDGNRRFADGDVAFAVALADRAGMAIDNARLFREVRALNEGLEKRVRERTAELHEALRDLEAFAYTIAHDLRAPLRAMASYSEIVLEDYGKVLSAGKGRDYLERIAAGAQQMDALIRDLLEYSRLSRADLKGEAQDLGRLVAEALGQLEADVRQSGARFELPSTLPRVRAHATTLRQVLINLLSNAIKFVAPGTRPEVRVVAEPRGDRVRLWVGDNGIGIDAAHISRVFGVFERLNRTEDYPGTGIGLAIVRRGIERMGGACGVESELGRGSRFWIELPSA